MFTTNNELEDEFKVSILPYMYEHKVLSNLLEMYTREQLDNYFTLIYLILDPRSPYFEIEVSIVNIIKNVLEDYPDLNNYYGDTTYNTLFEFCKKFQDTNLRKEIKSFREEIENWKEVYNVSSLDMKHLKTKDDTAFFKGLMDIKRQITSAELELAEMINRLKEISEEVNMKIRAGETLSMIEESYLKHNNLKRKQSTKKKK